MRIIIKQINKFFYIVGFLPCCFNQYIIVFNTYCYSRFYVTIRCHTTNVPLQVPNHLQTHHWKTAPTNQHDHTC